MHGELRAATRQETRGLEFLQVNTQTLTQDLNLKLEIQLQIRILVQFDQEAKHSHEPRIWWLEDARVCAVFQHLTYKRDCDNETTSLVAL